MRKDKDAYEKLYALFGPVSKAKNILELAAGTGLISRNIVREAQ